MNGADGYTPERGKDYWTEEDRNNIKDEAVQDIQPTLEEYQKQIEALEAENKKQQEEIDMLTADYKEGKAEDETAVVSDGLPKSKIKADINGNSYQETTENSPSTEEPSDIEVITECSLVQRGINEIETFYISNVAGTTMAFSEKYGTVIRYGVEYTWNKDGTVRAKGTATELSEITLITTEGMKKFKTGIKHMLNGCPSGGSSSSYRLGVVAGGVHSWDNYDDFGNGRIFTFVEGENYSLRLTVYKGQTVDLVFKPMIYKYTGTVGTDYEPYIEPIVHSIDLAGNSLAKIKNTDIKDNLLIGINGSVKLNKNINIDVITGNETLGLNTANGYERFYKMMTDIKYDGSTSRVPDVMSNYFKTSIVDGYSITYRYQQQILFYTDGTIRTLEDFKAWVKEKYNSGNPLKVIYQKAETEVIDLPSIEPITLFNGTNIFELVTNLGTTLAVTYKVSNKKKILNLEERISALESAVIGG